VTNNAPSPFQIAWARRHEAAKAELDKEWGELGERINAAIQAARSIYGHRHELSLNLGMRPQLAAEIEQHLTQVRQIMHDWDWQAKRRRRIKHETD
jgi:hypothetical protein